MTLEVNYVADLYNTQGWHDTAGITAGGGWWQCLSTPGLPPWR